MNKLNLWFMFKKLFVNHFTLFFISIVLISFLYDYPKILSYRPNATHQWRQVDGAAIALNYYADTLSFFKPAIQMSLPDGNNKAVSEFPIIYFSVAILWRLFGYHEFIFRLLDLIIVYVGLFYLFKLLNKIFNGVFWALLITILLFSSPVLVYYSNNFIPNAPAFGLVLAGWYYFYHFTRENKNKYLYLFIFFFLLAGLIKITSLMSFCIVSLLFLLEVIGLIKFDKNKRIFNKPLIQVIPFIILILLIYSWFRFAQNYNNKNVYGVFLMSASPIWEIDFGKINYVVNCIFNIMLPQLLNKFLLQAVLLLFLILIFCNKRVNRILMTITVTSFIACSCYILLFFTHFEDHDYYQIDLLIFPLSVLVTFAHFLYLNYTNLFNSKRAKIIVSIIVFCSIIYCSSYTRIKYNTNDVFARYAFFIDFRTKAKYEAEQANEKINFRSCETVTSYLRTLGIDRTDKVISLPDFSPDISLYLMDQKGYTNYCLGEKVDKLTPEIFRNLNSKYLIVLQKAWLEKESLKPYLKFKIGEYNNISIFDLRPFVKETYTSE
jgi:hypothetical protein